MSNNLPNNNSATANIASATTGIVQGQLNASSTLFPSSTANSSANSSDNANLDIGTILLISVGASVAFIIIGSIIYMYRQRKGLDDSNSVLKINDKGKDFTINHKVASTFSDPYPSAALAYYEHSSDRNVSPKPHNSSDYMYSQAGALSNYQLPNLSLSRSEAACTPTALTNSHHAGSVAYYDPPVERNESPPPDNSSDYNYRQSEFLSKYQLPTLPLERSQSRHSTINHPHPAGAVAYYDPPVERNESPPPDNSSDYNYRQSEFLSKYQLPTLPLERSQSRHSTINHFAEAKPSAVAYYDPPIERHGSPIPNNYVNMHRHTVNLSNYQLPNTSFVRSETRHSTINPPPRTSTYPAAVYSYVDAPIERSDSPMSDYMYRQTGDQSNYQSSDHSYYRSASYYY